jgi:hypothetical protein
MNIPVNEITICDDCSLVAYDKGIGVVHEWDYEDLDEFDAASEKGQQSQIDYMVDLGGILADHNCSAHTAPGLNIQCNCGCR